jgi:hypothetical protein
MRYPNRWTIGEWTFYEAVEHGFSGPSANQPLYGFTVTAEEQTDDHGRPRVGEWYNSLDHAMVAAIAEKHTGKRGAGGSGVGWFMKMIGAGQIQEAGPDGGRAMVEVLADPSVNMGNAMVAHRIERGLEERGYVIARTAIG